MYPRAPRRSARWRTSTATAALPTCWWNFLIALTDGILPSGAIDHGLMWLRTTEVRKTLTGRLNFSLMQIAATMSAPTLS